MTSDQYRAALAALDLTQAQVSEFLGITDRTSRNYAREGVPESGPGRAVGLLLAVMVRHKITPDMARKAHG